MKPNIFNLFQCMKNLIGYVFLQLYCVYVFSKLVKINFPQWHKSISAVVKFNLRGVKNQFPRW